MRCLRTGYVTIRHRTQAYAYTQGLRRIIIFFMNTQPYFGVVGTQQYATLRRSDVKGAYSHHAYIVGCPQEGCHFYSDNAYHDLSLV